MSDLNVDIFFQGTALCSGNHARCGAYNEDKYLSFLQFQTLRKEAQLKP